MVILFERGCSLSESPSTLERKLWRKERITIRKAAIALGDTEEATFLCDRKQRKVREKIFGHPVGSE
jgi:hypothetical protein